MYFKFCLVKDLLQLLLLDAILRQRSASTISLCNIFSFAHLHISHFHSDSMQLSHTLHTKISTSDDPNYAILNYYNPATKRGVLSRISFQIVCNFCIVGVSSWLIFCFGVLASPFGSPFSSCILCTWPQFSQLHAQQCWLPKPSLLHPRETQSPQLSWASSAALSWKESSSQLY